MVDVCTADGDRRRVHERRILELGLHVGAVLDDDTSAELDRCASIDTAEQRMLRLIARRGRSRAELLERLAALGIGEADADATVGRLEQAGLINDRVLAAEVVDRGERRGHGRLRRQHDLRRLQLDAELPDDPERERVRAEAVVRKRFGAVPTAPADLARASAYLTRRGFDADTVATTLHLSE